MSDKRKLQGEMDRCFKKIHEGVESFEDIWQKLRTAHNTNQKDKYENEMKKEIKKLQRLRDQLKTWASSNDVKDKKILFDYRKLIETQMERFKVVERETKTKAYSKEGLVSATKVNPAQKVKDETMQWLQVTIDAINRQVDNFEGEIETFNSLSKKKKQDRDKQTRMEDLRNLLEKHRHHIKNLETLMRMLDNQTIKPDKINAIREDIEYYLEACLEPGFEDNEFLYEDMGLDETLASNIISTTSPTEKQLNSSFIGGTKEDESISTLPASTNHVNSKEDESRKRLKSEDIVSPRKPNNHTTVPRTTTSRSVSFPAPSVNTSATTTNKQSGQKPATGPHNQPYAAAAAPLSSVQSSTWKHPQPKPEADSETSAQSKKQSTNRKDSTSWSSTNHVASTDLNSAEVQNAVDSIVSSVASLTITAKRDAVTTLQSETAAVDSKSDSVSLPSISSTPAVTLAKGNVNNMPPPANDSVSFHNNLNSLKSMAEQAVASAGIDEKKSSLFSHTATSQSFTTVPTDSRQEVCSMVQSTTSPSLVSSGVGEAHIPPLLGVAPLGSASLSKDQIYQQAMVEACWRHMPHPSDTERLRHYLPRNPCPTPSYYHQTPMLNHDSIEFYLRLSTETLFFIFYYMEATKAQYMAAKALKKQSWRFHTKYMMWFQRHEEPKTITDEYEQGTYIYFDYERWGQRKKEGFTFEYRYLEDRELQ